MRNHTKLFVLLTSLTAICAFACQSNDAPARTLTPTDAAEIRTYQAVGIVKSADADAGKITVDHEDIPGYMGAMEMTESVSDPKMLEPIKTGDKIAFEMQRSGSKLLITKLTKIGEVALTNGGEIYKLNCAECHGDLGEGALQGISLLKGHALKHSETDFIKRVSEGKEEKDKKMPAFKDKLTDEQIAAVVKFIREDLQKSAAPEKEPPQ
jgi:Cu/Ag efflux protein CusF